MTNNEGYASVKDWTESEESDKMDRPHWCSRIRNVEEEFNDKFGEKVANIDNTQR